MVDYKAALAKFLSWVYRSEIATLETDCPPCRTVLVRSAAHARYRLRLRWLMSNTGLDCAMVLRNAVAVAMRIMVHQWDVATRSRTSLSGLHELS